MRLLHSKLLILTAFAAVVMFTGLNFRELVSGDETRVAGVTSEMAVSGDLVTPKLNGEAFLEYPPLHYQLGALAFRVFGHTDAAAKLPGALCAFGAALLVFALARRLKLSEDAALTAGVLFLTGAQVFDNGRKCMVDMMLAFFVLLAVYAFHTLADAKRFRTGVGAFLLYSAGLAGGFMTKGLIGFAFPWCGLGVWLAADDLLFAKRFTFKRYLLLVLGAVPALVPILYWLRRLYLAGGREHLHTVLVENGFGRLAGTQGDHVEVAWYYFLKLPSLFQPWLLVFLTALVCALILLRKRKLEREILPLVCESVAPFIMLSCSAAKRQVYLLPIYSAWALLTAWFLIDRRDLYMEKLRRFAPWAVRYWRQALTLLAAASLIAFAVIAPGWAKTIPVAALALLAAAVLGPRPRTLAGLLTLALFTVSFDAALLARGNRKKSLRPLFEECRKWENKGYRITIAGTVSKERVSGPERTRGAAFFYLGKRVPVVGKDTPVQPNEKRIVRSDEDVPGQKFADRHYLIGNTK